MLSTIVSQRTNSNIAKHIGTPQEIEAREADAKALHNQLVVICQRHPRFLAGRVRWGAITVSKSMHSYQVRINEELVFDYQAEVINGYDGSIGYYSKPMAIHLFRNGAWRVLVDVLEQDALNDGSES